MPILRAYMKAINFRFHIYTSQMDFISIYRLTLTSLALNFVFISHTSYTIAFYASHLVSFRISRTYYWAISVYKFTEVRLATT